MAADDVDQADRVARGDGGRRRQAAQETRPCRSRPRSGTDAEQSADRCRQGSSASPRRTNSRATGTSASRIARSICAGPKFATSGFRPRAAPARDLLVMMGGEMAEGGAGWPACDVCIGAQGAAIAAADRNCHRLTAPGSCRTISAPASRRPRPIACGHRHTRCARARKHCGAWVSVTTPKRKGRRRRTSRSIQLEPPGRGNGERSCDYCLYPRTTIGARRSNARTLVQNGIPHQALSPPDGPMASFPIAR